MRGCRHARDRMLRAADGELPLEERFLLEEHLARCASCAALHERTMLLAEGLARLPEPLDVRLDVDRAVASIRAAIEAQPDADAPRLEPARPARRRWLALAVGLAAASLALLMLVPRAADSVASDALEVAPAPAPAAAVAPTTPETALPETAQDVERRVRPALRAAFRGSEEADDVGDAVLRFEALTSSYRLWPMIRIAEGLLDEEPAVARCAARYLGVRGDRISVSQLRASLHRRDIAPCVVRALGDLGPRATDALREALDEPELFRLALVELREVGGRKAALAIGAALIERLDEDAALASDPLDAHLQALAGTGASAVDVLLRLGADERLETARVLGWLDAVDQGDEELVALLATGSGGHRTALLIEATTRLQPAGALPWLEERCRELRNRDGALAGLAQWHGTAPLRALQRLDAAGGVADEDLLATFLVLAQSDGLRVAEHARALLGARDVLAAERYLELLIALDHPAAAPALVHLAGSELLSEDDRQWAALAVGELGRSEDAVQLLHGLARLEPDERRLWAACLITIDRHLGAEGTDEALAEFSAWNARRVREALDDVAGRGLGAVGLNRVARALDGALPARTSTWNQAL